METTTRQPKPADPTRGSVADDYACYSRREYLAELVRRVAAARPGDRVLLSTMAYDIAVSEIERLMHELRLAAARGVQVRIFVDAFSFMVKSGLMPGPLFFAKKLPNRLARPFTERLAGLENIQANGGSYTITNLPTRPLSTPFAGRSHIKFAVVNDYVMFGGCNLNAMDQIDVMIGVHNSKLANWLSEFSERLAQQRTVRRVLADEDQVIPVDELTTLLVDAGRPNQSVILDQALALIDEATEHIWLTCQYFPNDITARHLSLALARGADVTILYNHPSRHPFPLLHHLSIRAEKLRTPGVLFMSQLPKTHDFLHAKVLVTDKGTMIGSHNYVRAGVRFGTAEMTLLSRDARVGSLARQAVEKQLNLV